MWKPTAACSAALLVLALAACGREADRASRQLVEDRAPADRPARAERVSRAYADDRASPADSGRRLAGAGLVWSSSRRGSAEDNAQRQFERNGGDFGASSVEDYARLARAFLKAPPKGTLEAVRSGGDRIYYDPRSNTFAAADREGLPRTMFKPRDGRAYWDQQQQRIADGTDRAGRSPSRGRDSGQDARS